MKKLTSFETPPHFRSLSLRNFRGFKKIERVRLAPLTFLVGPNSSGKSSLFDALLLLTQSKFLPHRSGLQVPNWIGPLVDLGSFRDAVYKHQVNLGIEIAVEISPYFEVKEDYRYGRRIDQPMRIAYTLKASPSDSIGRLAQIELGDSLSQEKLILRYQKRRVVMEAMGTKLFWSSSLRDPLPLYLGQAIHKAIDSVLRHHQSSLQGRKAAWSRIERLLPLNSFLQLVGQSERVSSGRAAPKRWYSIAESKYRGGPRESPRVFDAVKPFMLGETPYYPRYRKQKQRRTVVSALNDLQIGNQLHDTKLSPYHLGISIKDNVTGVTSSLIDVGYGASQVIPVLKACLSNGQGPLFIEQPEIHLHPKAQGTVADLICDTSRYRQVVVETHSVHMINRARIMIAKGELPASHVVVNYVERTKGGSRVQAIPILDNGDFGVEWPEGFFDERYEDTMLLLKLKSNREK